MTEGMDRPNITAQTNRRPGYSRRVDVAKAQLVSTCDDAFICPPDDERPYGSAYRRRAERHRVGHGQVLGAWDSIQHDRVENAYISGAPRSHTKRNLDEVVKAEGSR